MKVKQYGESKETEGNVVLTNCKGGFLNLGKPNSKFQGWFVKDGEEYKIIEEIKLDGGVTELFNEVFCIKRKKSVLETYMFPKNFNTLIYELSSVKEISIVFDIRKAYDMSEQERDYEIKKEHEKIIIYYKKEGIHTVIGNAKKYEILNKWEQYDYTTDEKRNPPPFTRFNYAALKLKTKKLVITAYKDKEKAIEENDFLLKNLTKIKKSEKNSVKNISKKETAVNLAANSLMNLTVQDGLIAGLPWFFQIWTRDEMISLKALTFIGEEQLAKKILIERLTQIDEKGRLPNRIGEEGISSADSIGWMFLRFNDVMKLLNKKEKELLKVELKNSIELLIKNFHKNGFFFSKAKETWMDTDFGGDTRKGFCIEIQALMLNMLDMAYNLTKEQIYKRLRDSLIQNIHNSFFKDRYLYDRAEDRTIRPNVFIAYYAYPKLLSKMEWQKCFEIALDRLWMEWGGIATIDKGHQWFTSSYTGQDNKSYHRGDCWYWMNCLAAVCMLRVNKKKFKDKIDKIYSACEKDIWQGGLGSLSELSSASQQTSDGCLNQAWSNAMFIELWKEMK